MQSSVAKATDILLFHVRPFSDFSRIEVTIIKMLSADTLVAEIENL